MPNCPVCSNSETELWSVAQDLEYFSTPLNYNYFHCIACFCIFIDPVPIDQLRVIYPPNYYSFVASDANLVTRIKEWLDKRRFRKLLSNLPSSKLKILDVGGGFGWMANLIRKLDHRVEECQIVDIDHEAGKLARERGHQYFEGRLEDFESSIRYDFILMLNLIEHVENPLALLQKASSLLNEKGIILIKTPNVKSFDAWLFRRKYWGGLHCPRHWVIFSENSFRTILAKTNLTIQSLEYTQGGPFWAFSLIIYLFRKGWVKVSASRPVVFHPLYPILSALTALFDYLRMPFAKTSQMFIVLKKSN